MMCKCEEIMLVRFLQSFRFEEEHFPFFLRNIFLNCIGCILISQAQKRDFDICVSRQTVQMFTESAIGLIN